MRDKKEKNKDKGDKGMDSTACISNSLFVLAIQAKDLQVKLAEVEKLSEWAMCTIDLFGEDGVGRGLVKDPDEYLTGLIEVTMDRIEVLIKGVMAHTNTVGMCEYQLFLRDIAE